MGGATFWEGGTDLFFTTSPIGSQYFLYILTLGDINAKNTDQLSQLSPTGACGY